MNIQRIAVLADIHGNADALHWALGRAADLNCDKVVVLGDLLTYGGQPEAVLNALDDLAYRRDCVFIRGNHDQFYFDLERGGPVFSHGTPAFIRESVNWTWSMIGQKSLWQRYDWRDHTTIGPIYFAHANPRPYGDWNYVASDSGWRNAAERLRAMGFSAGVFAHSHRAFSVSIANNGEIAQLAAGKWHDLGNGQTALFNPGPVGQPRGTGLSFVILSLGDSSIRADFVPIDIDFASLERTIEASSLSAATQEKIISYLRA